VLQIDLQEWATPIIKRPEIVESVVVEALDPVSLEPTKKVSALEATAPVLKATTTKAPEIEDLAPLGPVLT